MTDYKVEEQPLPQENDNPRIHDLVSEDIQKRKEVGIKRYGSALQAHNGRDGLLDGYEEVLDLSVYLRQELEERASLYNLIAQMFVEAGAFLSQTTFQIADREVFFKDIKDAINRLCRYKEDYTTLHRERNGEVWVWQGDGEDHLESLTCPILIQPEDLKSLHDLIYAFQTDVSLIGNVAAKFGWNGVENSKLLWKFLDDKLTELTSPIPMLLFCPRCHKQHIDKAQPGCYVEVPGGYCTSEPCVLVKGHAGKHSSDPARTRWTNPPHRSHQCHYCGCTWRPADVPTVGVENIQTHGDMDNWHVSETREE